MRVSNVIILLSVLVLIASPLGAQVTTAGIFGTVTDRSGAVFAIRLPIPPTTAQLETAA